MGRSVVKLFAKDQLSLDYDFDKWPSIERFPLNLSDKEKKVYHILERDILDSKEYLIITGFTSLSQIVESFGTDKFNHLRKVRILIGNDPILRKRSRYPFNYLELELREYWLNKGISLYLGSSVINIIDKIEKNLVSIRFTKKSHAKIYVGDHHSIMGSSNFSKQGLELQQEANVREGKEEKYDGHKQIANNFYDEGKEYNTEIIALLKELLSDVTWEEALARGIAEILEGKWFSNQNEFFNTLSKKKFWPTQSQGLIEAINILIDKGNVLIADPTGSGKTRMCSAISIAFIYWLWQNGEKFKSNFLLLAPPIVKRNWDEEFRDFEYLSYQFRSIGVLSNATDENLRALLEEIKIANILAIDEAHNLLNPDSNRSRRLSANNADYKILITATPVNKKLDDLIRIIELLDIDNLSDSDFDYYKSIKESGFKDIRSEDRERLKGFIDNFLVRRTKSELNAIIDRDPESHKNRRGKECRYPKVNDNTYTTQETENDIEIVKQINNVAQQLKGINYLQKFDPSEYLIRVDTDKEKYINQRVGGAKNLAIYCIRACLRSSNVALFEYLLGTKYVKDEYDLFTNKNLTGNIIETITELKTVLPERTFESEAFPSWIINLQEYEGICDQEIEIYNKIISLAMGLSFKREEGKAKEILKRLKEHNIVIAFDSKLITLDYLQTILPKDQGINSYVATGSNKSIIEKILKVCELGTQYRNTVVFCSDVMSEGVNLQGASSLMLLDLPSVVRLVEQRIGRIDRMDTEHLEVEVSWPNDSEEYSLKGDKRLINTSFFVDSTLGGNYHIPEELREKHFENVDDIESIQRELKEKQGDKGWEGSHNFFKPIEQLKERFITKELYNLIRDVHASSKARVSFYKSAQNWCFITTRGNIKESPKWLFLQSGHKPINNFLQVAAKLNELLPLTEEARLSWDQTILDDFLKEFRGFEKYLLPEKKRRALEVAKYVLEEKLKKNIKDTTYKVLLSNNLALFNTSIKEEITDFYSLSELWLEVLKPYLITKRNKRSNRRKALNLSSLKEDWNQIDLSVDILRNILENCQKVETIDYRIAACIVGVGPTTEYVEIERKETAF